MISAAVDEVFKDTNSVVSACHKKRAEPSLDIRVICTVLHQQLHGVQVTHLGGCKDGRAAPAVYVGVDARLQETSYDIEVPFGASRVYGLLGYLLPGGGVRVLCEIDHGLSVRLVL